MSDVNFGIYFLSEVVGTAMLVLLGCGVVANVVLTKTKGNGGGFLLVNWGWGLAVYAGVIVSVYSGAQLNPAVSIGLLVRDMMNETGAYTIENFMVAVAGQMVGAFLGAVVCWITYRQHFDAEEAAAAKLGVFSTGPEIRSYGHNFITEVVGTFVLVFVIFGFNNHGIADIGVPQGLGGLSALPVALLVVGIGASLGGPTGYAINPARDLGPRIAHAILPIKGKGSSDWGYSWVPVAGPMVGGVLAALASPIITSFAG